MSFSFFIIALILQAFFKQGQFQMFHSSTDLLVDLYTITTPTVIPEQPTTTTTPQIVCPSPCLCSTPTKCLITGEIDFSSLTNDSDQRFTLSNEIQSLDIFRVNISILRSVSLPFDVNLKSLNLTLNSIHFIANDAFDEMRNITRLIINKNLLTMVPVQALFVLSKLREIDLSNNNIEILPTNFFANFVNLEIVHLNHNQLKVIERQMYPRRIKTLELKGNQLTRIDFIDDFPSYFHVNLRDNPIICHCNYTELIETAIYKSIRIELDCFDNIGQLHYHCPPDLEMKIEASRKALVVKASAKAYPIAKIDWFLLGPKSRATNTCDRVQIYGTESSFKLKDTIDKSDIRVNSDLTICGSFAHFLPQINSVKKNESVIMIIARNPLRSVEKNFTIESNLLTHCKV